MDCIVSFSFIEFHTLLFFHLQVGFGSDLGSLGHNPSECKYSNDQPSPLLSPKYFLFFSGREQLLLMNERLCDWQEHLSVGVWGPGGQQLSSPLSNSHHTSDPAVPLRWVLCCCSLQERGIFSVPAAWFLKIWFLMHLNCQLYIQHL